MKKALCILIAAALIVLTLVGCGKTKTLHCDACNAEIKVSAKENAEEDWINYCDDCYDKLLGAEIDDILNG